MIDVVIEGKIPRNFVLVEGFQGIGFVATLAVEYLAEKLKAKQIGYIYSDELPPMLILYKGKINYLMRVYHFKLKKKNFLMIASELPIPSKMVNEISTTVIKWAKKNKCREIVSFEGVVVPSIIGEPKVYGIANDETITKRISKYVSPLRNGLILGMSAALLMKSKQVKIPAYCMLAEAHPDYPDARAAAVLIKKFNEIYGTNVSTEELLKEAEDIEKKLMKVIEKAKRLSQRSEVKQYIG